MTRSEAPRLEAWGEYGSMSIRDFHSRLYWPAREAEIRSPKKEM